MSLVFTATFGLLSYAVGMVESQEWYGMMLQHHAR
ncbi:hypothetical protein Mal65_52060 [Crateriforma conspicua]|nr:hypothetical protein Mal65_52060 [Crateriforma conspicua]